MTSMMINARKVSKYIGLCSLRNLTSLQTVYVGQEATAAVCLAQVIWTSR